MPKYDKYHAKWKANMAKCSKYHTKCKVTMPKCSKYHAKWEVLVLNCCKYKANGTGKEVQKKTKTWGKKNPKTILHPQSNRCLCYSKSGASRVELPQGNQCNCREVVFWLYALSAPLGVRMCSSWLRLFRTCFSREKEFCRWLCVSAVSLF